MDKSFGSLQMPARIVYRSATVARERDCAFPLAFCAHIRAHTSAMSHRRAWEAHTR